MTPLPCQRCGRTPADPTKPVERPGKDEPEYYCRDCWKLFEPVLTDWDLAREARAKKAADDQADAAQE